MAEQRTGGVPVRPLPEAPLDALMAGPPARLHVAVITPEQTLYEGEADLVVAPAWDGEIGVLRGHAPMLVLLGTGELRIRENGGDRRFRIEGGFLQIAEDVVTVLSERASV
jgi:F-type H+-transporting ATPase subunit epsilon